MFGRLEEPGLWRVVSSSDFLRRWRRDRQELSGGLSLKRVIKQRENAKWGAIDKKDCAERKRGTRLGIRWEAAESPTFETYAG